MNVRGIAALGLAIALTSAAAYGPTAAEPPEWTLREDLRLGNAEGRDDDLRSISGVVIGRDGSISAVTRGGDVVVFDRAGKVLHRVVTRDYAELRSDLRERAESTMARFREGLSVPVSVVRTPRAPATSGRIGDTLWVMGDWARKIILIDGRGRVARKIPYTMNVEGYPSSAPLALLADRSLLRTLASEQPTVAAPSLETVRPPPTDGYRMPIIPAPPVAEDEAPRRGFLVRASADGRVLQGLEIFAAARTEVVFHNPYREAVTFAYPFRDDPLIAATPDGSQIVFVERYGAEGPGPATYGVAWFDVSTGKRTGHRHPYSPSAVTLTDSVVDAMLDSVRSPVRERFLDGFPSRAAARSAFRAALNAPPHHTPFTEILAGTDSTVWLRHRASDRWDVHTKAGRIAGRVTLPRDARLVHADGVALWVATPQSGGPRGADLLVRYRIVRP